MFYRKVSYRTALVITALMLLVGAGWTHGTFDNFLWKVGLNYQDCAVNGFGAVFCGDALKEYQQRIDSIDNS